jgi:superfamily II DNA helicase RecQ
MDEIAVEIKSRRGQCGIVYCFSQLECEKMNTHLRAAGIRSAYYHAGLQDDVCIALGHVCVCVGG